MNIADKLPITVRFDPHSFREFGDSYAYKLKKTFNDDFVASSNVSGNTKEGLSDAWRGIKHAGSAIVRGVEDTIEDNPVLKYGLATGAALAAGLGAKKLYDKLKRTKK